MSFGTAHTFKILDKNSSAMDGQRLVRLIAKGKSKSPNLSESLCVSIPVMTAEIVAEHIDTLLPYVVGMVQATQDKLIRSFRVESGADVIPESDFDMKSVLGYLAENGEGETLTAEFIREWFVEDYCEVIKQWILQRPGCAHLPSTEIDKKFAAITDVMTQFASGSKSRIVKPVLNMVLTIAKDVECDARLTQIALTAQRKLDAMNQVNDALEGLI